MILKSYFISVGRRAGNDFVNVHRLVQEWRWRGAQYTERSDDYGANSTGMVMFAWHKQATGAVSDVIIVNLFC